MVIKMNIKQAKAHLNYTLKHKWYVAIECFKRGLYIEAITHDISKFKYSEFKAYAEFYFNEDGTNKPVTTKIVPSIDAFVKALHLHQSTNKHHWQYWVMPTNNHDLAPIEMPRKYVEELICDWIGAGKAKGTPDNKAWYLERKDQLVLHKNTRRIIEDWLNL